MTRSRSNDRTNEQLRTLSLSQSILSRLDGSAHFSFGSLPPPPLLPHLLTHDATVGNTGVLASVTGPAEVKLREERVDRATLQLSIRPLQGPSSQSLLPLPPSATNSTHTQTQQYVLKKNSYYHSSHLSYYYTFIQDLSFNYHFKSSIHNLRLILIKSLPTLPSLLFLRENLD